MDAIERRAFMKAQLSAGLLFQSAVPEPAHRKRGQGARGAAQASGLANRRLLDLLKIEHPIVQRQWEGT